MESITLTSQERMMLAAIQVDADGLMECRLGLCESPIERLFLLALCWPSEWKLVPWPSDFIPHKDAIHPKIDGLMLDSLPFAELSQYQSPRDIDRAHAILGKKSGEFGFAFGAIGRSGGDSYVLTQVSIPGTPFRCDFVLVDQFDTAVIVETDGHDFHERTKEQAARDRERDRILGLNGWPLLRFTGSEIWKNPKACAAQARIFVAVERERRRGTPRRSRGK